MQEVIIDIDPAGNVKVEGKGFVGSECQAVTRAIEEALGDVEQVELKAEFRQTKSRARTAVK